MKATSKQIGGDHYKSMAMQPSAFIRANNLGWYEANIVKYICRHKQKGEEEDVEKVIHYAQLLLQEYEERKVGLDDRPKEDTKARMVQDTEVLLEEQGVMPSDSNCSLFSYTECPKDRGAPNEWN